MTIDKQYAYHNCYRNIYLFLPFWFQKSVRVGILVQIKATKKGEQQPQVKEIIHDRAGRKAGDPFLSKGSWQKEKEGNFWVPDNVGSNRLYGDSSCVVCRQLLTKADGIVYSPGVLGSDQRMEQWNWLSLPENEIIVDITLDKQDLEGTSAIELILFSALTACSNHSAAEPSFPRQSLRHNCWFLRLFWEFKQNQIPLNFSMAYTYIHMTLVCWLRCLI